MTRTYYRLSLVALSALAAFGGPIYFLEDRARLEYLAGGLAAALLTWVLLILAIAMESQLQPGLAAILGAGLAIPSWATIALVAVFEIIPHALQNGLARFDPVWMMGGLSPFIILPVAWWRTARERASMGPSLAAALLRFSLPLAGLELAANVAGLPKQFRWLFLFTGVMFLVLDGLGAGGELPFLPPGDHGQNRKPGRPKGES